MLEDLPESFILKLNNIDPVVGMISKKLHKSCGVSRIDAWKFLNSEARYTEASNNLNPYDKVYQGLRSIMVAKDASGDIAFNHMMDRDTSLYRAAQWACKYDVPRILEPCLEALRMYSYCYSSNIKAQLIWFYASLNGSTRVLSWFLKNMPDLMRLSIQYMYCENSNTVKWCIENLLISPPAPVNWVMMKTSAIVKKNTVSMDLLDWVVIPPCPLDNDDECGDCPACMIRNNYIHHRNILFGNI
jgi:hypothetical protein